MRNSAFLNYRKIYKIVSPDWMCNNLNSSRFPSKNYYLLAYNYESVVLKQRGLLFRVLFNVHLCANCWWLKCSSISETCLPASTSLLSKLPFLLCIFLDFDCTGLKNNGQCKYGIFNITFLKVAHCHRCRWDDRDEWYINLVLQYIVGIFGHKHFCSKFEGCQEIHVKLLTYIYIYTHVFMTILS